MKIKKRIKLSNEQIIYVKQFIKDLEDTSKSDQEAWEKFKLQNLSEDLKVKLREYRVGPNENSLLHLAAKTNRKMFCSFLINDLKIG